MLPVLMFRLVFRSCWLLLAVAAVVKASILSHDGLQAKSANGYPPTLSITSGPTLTSKWFEGSDYEQVVEMIITNSHPKNSLTLADTLNVTAVSDSLYLTRAGTLTRLGPGQSAVVQIGVKPNSGFTQGSTCSITVTLTYGESYGSPITSSSTASGVCGVQYDYTNTTTSVNHHWNPDWYNEVKYGIFIHWGLYSAPAYGSVAPNEDYAEWYWHRLNDGPTYKTHTYQYHNETYGESFNYDYFMSNFTASKFDAKTWIDLINTAGAQYFVPVTKHHDGFALFNFSTAISERSSVHYGPKRDFISELFAAAKEYYPSLRRGTYFSLPEWYNPDYAKYAYSGGGGFPGGPPTNPYTGAVIPYTGHVDVSDFIADVQMPQMYALAYDYDTEIMWCDIEGSANNAGTFAANFINYAMAQNRQVTFNNRCGGGSGFPGDFDTPEYTTNADSVSRKWESNRGMDPFSFGYNYQTPDSSYLTGAEIVASLVDIVSKNGNFLLDIGPTNEGVVPDIMVQGLTDAGAWIHAHSESIFSTRYWLTTPGEDPYRYTTTDGAFYVHINEQPGTTITPPDKIPFLPGDTVTVLGGTMSGTEVPTTLNSNGTITMTITDAIISADKYVWTFKIAYTSTW